MSPATAPAAEAPPPAFPVRLVAVTLLRCLLTVAALVALYYVAPLNADFTTGWVLHFLVVAATLGALMAIQVWRIFRSPHPVAQAVNVFAFAVPVFLLSVAAVYYVISHDNPAAFSEPLTRTDSLYFAVTVFATVGFGDLVAKTEGTRALVTVQMLSDLVFLGVVIKAIAGAAKRSMAARGVGLGGPREPAS